MSAGMHSVLASIGCRTQQFVRLRGISNIRSRATLINATRRISHAGVQAGAAMRGSSLGRSVAARTLAVLAAASFLTSLMGCSTTRVTVDRDSSIRLETVTVGDIRIEPRLVKAEQEKLIVAGYVVPLTNTLGSQVGHLHVTLLDNQDKMIESASVRYDPQLFRLRRPRYAQFYWQPKTALTTGCTVRIEYATDKHRDDQ